METAIEKNLQDSLHMDNLTNKMLIHCMDRTKYDKYKNSISKKNLNPKDFNVKDE